jgi:hypothetical protein
MYRLLLLVYIKFFSLVHVVYFKVVVSSFGYSI